MVELPPSLGLPNKVHDLGWSNIFFGIMGNLLNLNEPYVKGIKRCPNGVYTVSNSFNGEPNEFFEKRRLKIIGNSSDGNTTIFETVPLKSPSERLCCTFLFVVLFFLISIFILIFVND